MVKKLILLITNMLLFKIENLDIKLDIMSKLLVLFIILMVNLDINLDMMSRLLVLLILIKVNLDIKLDIVSKLRMNHFLMQEEK